MSFWARVIGRLPPSWIKAASRAQWKHPLLRQAVGWFAGRLRHQDGTIARGVGRGLRFNPGPANAGYLLGTSEPGVQAALAGYLRPGMTVYDVGANVGFLSVLAARLVGPGGRVVCFEPFPDNARQVEHNFRLNGFTNLTVRAEALGDQPGEADFQVSAESTWGKLASVGGGPPERQVGTIRVPVRRLDDAVADGLPAPDLVKIDVEGAEAGVLAGAAETIRRARPLLLIELHGTNRAIAERLDAFDYVAAVLGSPASVVDSPWDAYVAAAPRESEAMTAFLVTLRDPSAGRR